MFTVFKVMFRNQLVGADCGGALWQDNALVRWCPSVPHCGRAIRVEGELHCEPECTCGLRFCFACGEDPHSPCTCDMCALNPPFYKAM